MINNLNKGMKKGGRMKSKSIDRIRMRVGNRNMPLGGRVDMLERAVLELYRAVAADFEELDLNSLSETGQKQLDERIKRISKEES